MRKNRIGYRKKHLLSLRGEGDAFRIRLEDEKLQFSGVLARWIYKHSSRWLEKDKVKIEALQSLRFAREPWVFEFLWTELRQNKADDIGDWILIALGDHSSPCPISEMLEINDLYYDPSATPDTRGSAIVVLSKRYSEFLYKGGKGEELTALIKHTCEHALWNEENGYARGGGTWLAKIFGGYDDRIREIQQDPTEHARSLANMIDLD